MFAAYVDSQKQLVIEMAVPGREAEDITIETTDAPGLIIFVAPTEETAGSILAKPLQWEVGKVDPPYSVNDVRAVCRYGLLKLVFPPVKPVPQPKTDVREFMRRQRFHLN